MDSWSSFPVQNSAQITKWFGASTAREAMPLSRQFTFLHWGHDYLNGIVEDAKHQRHEVGTIFLRDSRGGLGFKTDCTCRENERCKHVAALFLAALDQKSPGVRHQEPEAAAIRPELSNWIEEFRAKAGAGAAIEKIQKPNQGLAYVLGWSSYPQC